MYSSTGTDKLAQLEQRLQEMRRRTISTLSVTNPDTGVKILEIGDNRVTFRANTGRPIFQSDKDPRWGLAVPWGSTVAFPVEAFGSSSGVADISVYEPYMTARLRPNNPRLLGGTTTRVVSSIGATCNTRVMYRVNGGSQVQITAADYTTTSTVSVRNAWEYLWPGDYFDDVIDVEFQARLSGTFDPINDFIFHGASRLYGARS